MTIPVTPEKPSSFHIQPVQPEQDAAIAHVIEAVGQEFGAIGEGFGPSDDEVRNMSRHYRPETRSGYWVAVMDGRVVGGGGIAPFAGSSEVCELRKLFLLPAYRGYGLGEKLTRTCLTFAQRQGYRQCYLDTLGNMTQAIALYEKLGFERLERPMDGSIHNGCDVWMLKALQPA
ncbi:GNAT family N-acetyltransferase [Marinobacteraceae bacterium S3BR75-40.1]